MGSMVLSEMRSALRWSLDNVGTGKVSDTQLERWINWAYDHVCMPSVYRHVALQASTENSLTLVLNQVVYNTNNVSPGLEFWGIYGAHYIAGTDSADYSLQRIRLQPEDIRWFDQGLFGAGRPARYALWGSQGNGATPAGGHFLYIDRRPTAAEVGHVLQLRGYRRPPKLTAATDRTVIYELWDEAILLGARWRGWRELNRPERAEIARVEFGVMINEITSLLQESAHDWGGRFELDLQAYQVGG